MLSCVRVCVFRASESVRVCRPGAAPGAPKRPQDPPKSTQRGSKRPPRVLQEAPRGPQETPRAGQEDKFFFEILICLACNYCECFVSLLHVRKASKLQICTAQMPCHRMADGHAKTWRAGGGVPPKGKAIRRPDRRGGSNGVSDSELDCRPAQVVAFFWSYS